MKHQPVLEYLCIYSKCTTTYIKQNSLTKTTTELVNLLYSF